MKSLKFLFVLPMIQKPLIDAGFSIQTLVVDGEPIICFNGRTSPCVWINQYGVFVVDSVPVTYPKTSKKNEFIPVNPATVVSVINQLLYN